MTIQLEILTALGRAASTHTAIFRSSILGAPLLKLYFGSDPNTWYVSTTYSSSPCAEAGPKMKEQKVPAYIAQKNFHERNGEALFFLIAALSSFP